ncbi:putative UDP-glucuronate 4-epimerase [Helianthus annuus]|nr:putative UDP-glucuronate 4-epimerase [Helianthus annuus]
MKWWEEKKGLPSLEFSNLGTTSPAPVSDLVSILEKLLKVKAKRRLMKLPRNGDVPFTPANISLAQREFGYKSITDLQTGLKKFVRWYEKYYGSGKKSDH